MCANGALVDSGAADDPDTETINRGTCGPLGEKALEPDGVAGKGGFVPTETLERVLSISAKKEADIGRN